MIYFKYKTSPLHGLRSSHGKGACVLWWTSGLGHQELNALYVADPRGEVGQTAITKTQLHVQKRGPCPD